MKTNNGSHRAGTFVRQQLGRERFSAFIPAKLTPTPPIVMDDELVRLHEAAAHALGRLTGAVALLEPERLLYMYVRKEAVLSSQIEGTQSTLSDLLKYEHAAAPGTPVDDVREVSRYVEALLYGAEQITTGSLPLSLRLIRDLHERLMREGHGNQQAPGEFRRTQNWLGGTRPGNATFVPPPAHEVMPALDNLERFIHDEFGTTPTLFKAGVAHAQFETIHPFLDGNGRVGRLLIALVLVAEGSLSQPHFYISLYFKKYRADYYDALQRVRTKGDWEGWMRFFLVGVEAVGVEAARTAETLAQLFRADRTMVERLGRAAPSALKMYDCLRQRILVSPTRAAEDLGLTWPTSIAALQRLEDLGIAREITGKKRNRIYAYQEQLRILDEGIELKS